MKHRESPIKRVNPSGRVVWMARVTIDGKRRKVGTFERKRDAQDAIDRAYEQPTGGPTLGGYVDRWLEEHPVSERTMRTNRGRINAVKDVKIEGRALKDWPLNDLRRRHAKELVACMLTEQERAPEGARNILRTLSVLAEDAITDELADLNPWRGVKIRDDDRRIVKQGREPRVWTVEQMHDFAAQAGKYEPMIRMLADCGLRIGELFALKRELQDLRTGIFRVRGSAWEGHVLDSSREKQHDREGPIPPGCLALLQQMPVRLGTPYLFSSPRGELWRYSNWHERVWKPIIEKKACKQKGLNPTPHEFRHSWISIMRAAGIDPADLAHIAGHSVETATARYTHALRRSDDAIRGVIG